MALEEVLVPCMALVIPIIAIIATNQRRMAEMKAQMGVGFGTESAALNEIRNELSELRREVSSLRDTSTTFDMGFDAAISRLEHRVDRIEDNGTVTPPLRAQPPARTEDEQVILGQKG